MNVFQLRHWLIGILVISWAWTVNSWSWSATTSTQTLYIFSLCQSHQALELLKVYTFYWLLQVAEVGRILHRKLAWYTIMMKDNRRLICFLLIPLGQKLLWVGILPTIPLARHIRRLLCLLAFLHLRHYRARMMRLHLLLSQTRHINLICTHLTFIWLILHTLGYQIMLLALFNQLYYLLITLIW